MVTVNNDYRKLDENYLFSEVAKRVAAYRAANPSADVISLGIGDVTRPLSSAVVEALKRASDEMAATLTFRGYAPECGYDFLKEKIIRHDYTARGVGMSCDEIFINDGAKSALGHFGDILGRDNVVAISDPVYPVYVDTAVMDGRGGNMIQGRWSGIVYLECPPEKDFTPQLPSKQPDIIYLCSPNNPTGNAMNGEQLKEWVDYARRHRALILFDSAYEAFISNPDIPHSIYEIEGAKEVAVEFRSYSKTAGFTGLRCGYTVVPKELEVYDAEGGLVNLNHIWRRHQSTKFNGTAYVVQRAAEAIYSSVGQADTLATIDYYMKNAKTILKGVRSAGMQAYGGADAPYIWVQTPDGMKSWELFDKMLNECQVVVTPGVGFGPSGEGYFRLTAFGDAEKVEEATERIKQWRR